MALPPEPCPRCATLLAAVKIDAGERTVIMRSCTRCDRRWWTADGAPVADPAHLFAKTG